MAWGFQLSSQVLLENKPKKQTLVTPLWKFPEKTGINPIYTGLHIIKNL